MLVAGTVSAALLASQALCVRFLAPNSCSVNPLARCLVVTDLQEKLSSYNSLTIKLEFLDNEIIIETQGAAT